MSKLRRWGISDLKFSIWDLAVLTTFVAAVFALPIELTQFLVAASCVVIVMVLLLLIITVFSAQRRKERRATAERFLLHLLWRSLGYSLAMLVIGGVAIVLKMWS